MSRKRAREEESWWTHLREKYWRCSSVRSPPDEIWLAYGLIVKSADMLHLARSYEGQEFHIYNHPTRGHVVIKRVESDHPLVVKSKANKATMSQLQNSPEFLKYQQAYPKANVRDVLCSFSSIEQPPTTVTEPNRLTWVYSTIQGILVSELVEFDKRVVGGTLEIFVSGEDKLVLRLRHLI